MKLSVIDSTKTTTYAVKGRAGFMLDIVDHGAMFEAFIYHEDYGIKELMFGSSKTQEINGNIIYMCYDDFKNMVLANLEHETYIQHYIDEYMD